MKRPRHFLRADSGLAAMEFALIGPIMVFLFFAIIEGSDALTASRKTSLAVNTLADLVAQELEVSTTDLTDLFTGMEDIIDSRDIDVTFTVVSLEKDEDDDVVVHWSRDSNGGAPYAAGSDYDKLPDDTLLDDTSTLIVGEVTYNYQPAITSFVRSTTLNSDLIKNGVTIENTAARWPRRSLKVKLCTAPGVCS